MADSSSNVEYKKLTGRQFQVSLGKSFGDKCNHAFHAINYDFKPKSVDTSKQARLKVLGDEIQVAYPNVQAETADDVTIFRGCHKPPQKDYILIINPSTGEASLERITSKINFKNTRTSKDKDRMQTSVRPVSPYMQGGKPATTAGSISKGKQSSKGRQSRPKKAAVDSQNSNQPVPAPAPSATRPSVPKPPSDPVIATDRVKQLRKDIPPQKRPLQQPTLPVSSSSGSSSESEEESSDNLLARDQIVGGSPPATHVECDMPQVKENVVQSTFDSMITSQLGRSLSESSSDSSSESDDSSSSSENAIQTWEKVSTSSQYPSSSISRGISVLNEDLDISSLSESD